MRYVVLDTNFLMSIEEFSFDFFSELNRLLDIKYKLVTLKPVVHELKRISRRGGEKGVVAKVGLKLLDKVKVLDTNIKGPDRAILDFAKKKDAIVCTNDKELKNKLRESGVKIIYLRSKTHLEMENK